MNTQDALNLAKAHPDVVSALLTSVAGAAASDPSLIADAIGAAETKSYTGFAFKHLGTLLNLVGIISAKPDLVAAIGKLGA